MKRVLEVIKKDEGKVNIELKELDLSYIPKIMEFQEDILQGLEDKQLYVATEENEFIEYLDKGGRILGYVTEEDEIIALGVFINKGYDEGNYGYDLDIKGEDLLHVGQIESTLVRSEYRGNSLQRILCEIMEKIAKEEDAKLITATASPYNEFSVNNFKKLGYEIKKDKIKYGGLRRYVLAKEL